MSSLWSLLLSAQSSLGGIPQQFIDEKKEELRNKQAQDGKRDDNTRRLDEIRDRERGERNARGGGRGRGRERDSGWGARGGGPGGIGGGRGFGRDRDRDDFDRVRTSSCGSH
jgi:serine/arginine repetitive matrix protein 1